MEDFKRSADTWRTRAESAAVLRSEFAEMLDEADEGVAATISRGVKILPPSCSGT